MGGAGSDGVDDLAVVTLLAADLGLVLCMTQCDACDEAGTMPDVSWPGAVERGWDHCGHLGVSPEEMAALIEMEGAE